MDGMVPGGFSGFRKTIASSALQAIADHWHQASAGKPMPAWSDLSPSAISPHLKRLWAFKYDPASGEFTARLAGNRVMARFGKSFRGTPLKELHPAVIFEQAHSHMIRIVCEPAFVRCTGRLFRIGERVVEGERIALPLSSDGHQGDGVLGASDFKHLPVPGPIELLYDRLEWFSHQPAGN